MNLSMLNRAVSAYQNVRVTTSSPGQVVVLLYDGALRFLREARAAHARGDRGAFGERISRAHAIIEVLTNTLDSKHDALLAERLSGLYAYSMRRIVTANVTNDPAPLEEVDRLLAPLRDAWAVAVAQTGVKTNTK